MARTNQTQCYFYRTCVSYCFVSACFCLIGHYLYTTQFLILCFNELGVLCFSLLICLFVCLVLGGHACLFEGGDIELGASHVIQSQRH